MQFPWNINFCNLMQDAALLWGGGERGEGGGRGEGEGGSRGESLVFAPTVYSQEKCTDKE